MLYFDTNFLVPLVRDEPTSDRIARFVDGLSRDQLAVSQWTRVELSSVLGRLVRMGELDLPAAVAADARFETLIAESFAVLLPTEADYGLARRYLGNYAVGLRAADALHLAIGANNKAESIFTLDKRLLVAGSAWGLPMSAGIEG
jgi:predicted nucleic acid-binding protein